MRSSMLGAPARRVLLSTAGRAHRRLLCTDAGGGSSTSGRTTHFGYSTVPEDDKERLVGKVFDRVASRYDLMNDVMSAGVHRVWKDTLVTMIGAQSLGRANLQVLDVAGGTGDIAFRSNSPRFSNARPVPRHAGCAT